MNDLKFCLACNMSKLVDSRFFSCLKIERIARSVDIGRHMRVRTIFYSVTHKRTHISIGF